MNKTKPYQISKNKVYEAFLRVKANKRVAGIDEESILAYELNLKDNLYKLWNRMSSGSYFPPAVKAVEIPKKTGGTRTLGIPTVGDRVVQMVVKLCLEPLVDSFFHEDSYGYRPGKSAIQVLEVTSLNKRLNECKLELHLTKTKIVYCKDADRKGKNENITFNFLGYTFRPRLSKNRWGKHFVNIPMPSAVNQRDQFDKR
ncbi:reverse transcriptase domain-containing protein [Bacillus sp. Marseille-P3661]|uniref:reverse transcriptase domain-containing protein n=1 Tax=Bacillus sp. Marseille-P3661 TaxID=1936234 RepID=UPI00215564F6|nr:reverse transcriptase domain-containing protein [Bacillus sp. Marseille-P3661]